MTRGAVAPYGGGRWYAPLPEKQVKGYVELHCHSAFSLLDGASLPEDLVRRAAALDMPALALTDHDGLYGAIRFYKSCMTEGIKPIIGAEMTLVDGSHITLLARNNTGYSNLCRIISGAQLGNRKGSAALSLESLACYAGGLLCLSGCRRGEVARSVIAGEPAKAYQAAEKLIGIFGRDDFYIELQNNLYPDDGRLCRALVDLAERLGAGYVATNNVHYARKEGHKLHDVLTCIRERTTLDRCESLKLNSEFYLKSFGEMAGLFHDYPEAVRSTLDIAERCNVNLDFSDYRFPDFPLPEGETADGYLAGLCRRKACQRYGSMSPEIEARIEHELALIARLELSGYFLIVWDIMDYAARHGIPALGRGSAANSIVVYILGITRVDPVKNKLFLGRFLNEEMSSVPDIDIDISTNHREKLIQYVYRKYGQEHTAMVCTYVTFQARNAIREVAKALGMPGHLIDRMAKSVSAYGAGDMEKDLAGIDEFQACFSSMPWQEFLSLCRQIADLPRHLSIHNGGMIISSCPLTDIVPLERAAMQGRVVCQWDKDGVADAGLIKIDLLGLRMLSLIDEALGLIAQHHGTKLNLDALSLDDERVYDMICRCDTVGVFQVESRAQMQTLPRTRPRSIEDLIVEVSIIRPGPIQGNMVHPYIRRKKGVEKASYLHPRLKPILQDTLGVILFQEQVIQVAIAIASFTPGEADSLRRAMSRKRSREAMEAMKRRFIAGAEGNGIGAAKADSIFQALKGFAQYGFCKSHAAGFALLCYQSAWLKCHYPVEFYCALLNNQPMGFYSPEVVVHDARRHGITVMPVDINRSGPGCTIEGDRIRLGFRYVRKMGAGATERVVAEKGRRPYSSLEDFYFRAGLERDVVENLILAGAFDLSGCSKRELLWRLGVLEKKQPGELPLQLHGVEVILPGLTAVEEMKMDYAVQQLSAKYHPMGVLRKDITGEGLLTSTELSQSSRGGPVRIAGYLIMMQRPPTAKGFAFMTLEDEEGTVNVVIRPDVYERYRQVCMFERLIVVEGMIQRRDGILNVIADALWPLRRPDCRVTD